MAATGPAWLVFIFPSFSRGRFVDGPGTVQSSIEPFLQDNLWLLRIRIRQGNLLLHRVQGSTQTRLLISYFTQAGSLPINGRGRIEQVILPGSSPGAPVGSFQPTPPTTLFLIGYVAFYVKVSTRQTIWHKLRFVEADRRLVATCPFSGQKDHPTQRHSLLTCL